MRLNDTHDPALHSWLAPANDPGCEFPIQNLPFGVFRRLSRPEVPRVGVAIGRQILDLHLCHVRGLFVGSLSAVGEACAGPSLNDLLRLGPLAWTELRRQVSWWLRADREGRSAHQADIQPVLVPQSDVEMLLPIHIGDYTDFYASIFHATNVGSMMRPDEPLLPNYKHVPIGYHGRASSVAVSGTPVTRPWGQCRPEHASEPVFAPTRRLDYELEVGAVVGPGNPLGDSIAIDDADRHLFGLCLVNDWSARDMQAWEYQPLGPFLAKSFLTSTSPWIVTLEALEPFRVAPARRPDGDPRPLPYLQSADQQERGAFDVRLEVSLSTAHMRATGHHPSVVSRSNLRHLYWTFGQLLAHHASNGCNLRPGDLIASGTVSGPTRESRGCLLELTWRGTDPISMPTGEARRFLEDGDQVIFRGRCERGDAVPIGFGECRGTVLPAVVPR